MAKTKEIDWNAIRGMTTEQKQQTYYALAKRANQRFRDIKKSTGAESGAIKRTKKYLQDTYKRDTFLQSRRLVGTQLNEGLKALEQFYTAKTSSVRGIKHLQKEHLNEFENKYKQEFDIQNYHIKDSKKFFDFLSSNQFQNLSKYNDSDQVIEDFLSGQEMETIQAQNQSLEDISKEYNIPLNDLERLNPNIEDTTKQTNEQITIRGAYSIDQIIKQYREYENSTMTFEQVNEKRYGGGKLLH